MTTGGKEVETPKDITLEDLRIEESNRFPGKPQLSAKPKVGSIWDNVPWKWCDAMNVVRWDTR